MDERDRRYAAEAQGRAEALRIKNEGDQEALRLAREIQTYKDEKANELRSQIESERGSYATKNDLGALTRELRAERRSGGLDARQLLFAVIAAVGVLWGIAGGPHP